MSRLFIISDPRGERRLTDSDLPFSLGRGPGVTIALPDPEHRRAGHEQILGWIAYSEDHPFIQPADDAELYHNRERITASAWLKSGDGLQSAGGEITWEVQGDQVFVRSQEDPLSAGIRADRTQDPPPWEARMRTLDEIGEETPVPAPILDRSAAYTRPLPRVGATPTRRRKSLKIFLGLALILLIAAAAFVLTATPLEISVEPAPDRLTVEGFPPTFRLGGRHLALPGRYTVRAEKSGYYPLSETFTLIPGEQARRRYTLEERPGYLYLHVRPESDYTIFVDQARREHHPDRPLELVPGNRWLRIATDRYLPFEQTLDILGKGEERRLDVELRPAWADIHLDSDPPGAEIELDGTVLGHTPKTIEVLQGDHVVRLSKPLHKAHTLPLQVTAGEKRTLPMVVLPFADGTVQLSSQPEGATVTLDEAYLGVTPLDIPLAPNQRHTLVLNHPGHVNREARVQLAPTEVKKLDLSLNPSYGIVFLKSTPADAQLRIDGQAAGQASRRLRLPTRAHELTIHKPGFLSERLRVTPKAGSAQRFDIILNTPKGAEAAARKAQMTATKTTADGQKLLLLRPGGAFEMGASRGEPGRRANEHRRRVQLTRPYYLADRELTNARYRRFREQHDSGLEEGSDLNTASQPVVQVTWDDAARYCNWLSARDGLPSAYEEKDGKMRLIRPVTVGYRLPTEAEWVYAARIHGRRDTARYPWGAGFPPKTKTGNYADARIADVLAVTVPGYDDGYRVSAPVGSFPAHAGFYDLGGNVAEWTGDYYSIGPDTTKKPLQDPLGPKTGEHRVVKDVGWKHGSTGELRLAYRDYSNKPRTDLGFRIARYAY